LFIPWELSTGVKVIIIMFVNEVGCKLAAKSFVLIGLE